MVIFLSKMNILLRDLNLKIRWINIFISKVLTFYPVNYLSKNEEFYRLKSCVNPLNVLKHILNVISHYSSDTYFFVLLKWFLLHIRNIKCKKIAKMSNFRDVLPIVFLYQNP